MMLIVKHVPSRTVEDGQYYVELTEFVKPVCLENINRLGYWCDKVHLKHMARALLKHFGDEMAESVLGRDGFGR